MGTERVERLEVVVDGVRSPVLQAGSPDTGEAVVFVHGNPGPKEYWTHLLEPTGAFARALAPDMPGFGAADRPESFDYSVAGYARHLGGVLDELEVRRAHLVLHDFGGPWGLAWAAGDPDRFASVTLIDTGVLIDYHWHRYARIWRTTIVGELFQRSVSRPAFRLLIGRENPGLSREMLDRVYEAFRPSKRAVLQVYRATPELVLAAPTAALHALDRPALVVWGTDDRYFQVVQAGNQHLAFPSARVELLQGNGHWALLEDPQRVAALVIPFLQRQLGV
jgi:pimeloyl-ACP methyl ester carboxylesterase